MSGRLTYNLEILVPTGDEGITLRLARSRSYEYRTFTVPSLKLAGECAAEMIQGLAPDIKENTPVEMKCRICGTIQTMTFKDVTACGWRSDEAEAMCPMCRDEEKRKKEEEHKAKEKPKAKRRRKKR